MNFIFIPNSEIAYGNQLNFLENLSKLSRYKPCNRDVIEDQGVFITQKIRVNKKIRDTLIEHSGNQKLKEKIYIFITLINWCFKGCDTEMSGLKHIGLFS